MVIIMTRQELMEMYANVLVQMAEAGEQGDKSVLLDKLIYMARKGDGDGEGDTYFVPEGFDLVAFAKDVKELA